MPANPALTSPELAALNAGNADCPVYLSYAPDTVVGTATVASSPSDPVTTILTSGESANWLTARAGQMAKFTDGSGNLVATRRVISVVHGTLTVDRSSLADVGLLPVVSRSHAISSGDTVTILERSDLWSRKPYVDTSGNILQDGNISMVQQNLNPTDIYNVTINNQPGDFFCNVVSGGTKVIVAAATRTQWFTNVGFIYSYSWSYPASFTSVSGALTATLTATAPVGAHWIYLTITPSLGDVIVLARFIRVHSPDDPPIYCNVTGDKRDRQSRSVTVRLVKERIAAIPTKGYCAIWSDGNWNGSDVATATKKFCGYVDTKSLSLVPGYHEGSMTIQGIAAVLDAIEADAINFNYLTSGTWESLTGYTQNLFFAMWWVANWRVYNLLQRFNWTGFTTDYHLSTQNLITAPRSSALAMLKRLAARYDANIGSRSDGEMESKIHPSLMADRSGVVKRATLTPSIYSNVKVTVRQKTQVGLLRYEGSTSTSLVADVALISQAPSESLPGQDGNTSTESEKVFEDQANANQRCGDTLAMKNNPYPLIELEILSNWDVFEMADMERDDVFIDAAHSPTGADLTITGIPIDMDKTWIAGRRAKIKLRLEGETNGEDGVTVTIPTPIATTPAPSPSPSQSSPNGVFTHNSASIVVLEGTTSGTPKGKLGGSVNRGNHWFGLTGSGLTGELTDMKFDPKCAFFASGTGAIALYIATSDGLFYSADITASSVLFVLKQAFSTSGGNSVIIRPSPSDIGVVYVGYVNAGSLPVYARLSNYGSTIDHSHAIGNFPGTNGPYSPAMDIDSFSDEMYVTATATSVDGTTYSWFVYRITNGGSPVRLDNTEVYANTNHFVIRFIQKPLNKFGGGVNNGLGNNAHLLWVVGDAINTAAVYHHIYYSTTGGTTTPTDIRPNTTLVVTCQASSMVATDNSDVIFFIDDFTGHLWTTRNRGGTWTDNGVATGGDYNPFGYFPRQIGGNYVLYYAANDKIYYSPDFGVTKIEITGDWSTSIGTPGQYFTVIPIS